VQRLVIDRHQAACWPQLFPARRRHPDVVVRPTGPIAWALRTGRPQLKAALNAVIQPHGPETGFGRVTCRRDLKESTDVQRSTAAPARRTVRALAPVFRTDCEAYARDWRGRMAQGSQDSRLDHTARRRHGAIGVMPGLPKTGILHP
jgi:membrane-bound lytic murein transglycosylase MltF